MLARWDWLLRVLLLGLIIDVVLLLMEYWSTCDMPLRALVPDDVPVAYPGLY